MVEYKIQIYPLINQYWHINKLVPIEINIKYNLWNLIFFFCVPVRGVTQDYAMLRNVLKSHDMSYEKSLQYTEIIHK